MTRRVRVEQANAERGMPVDLEVTEYVLLALLVLLGVLVRHRLRPRKSQQPPPQQATQSTEASGPDQTS